MKKELFISPSRLQKLTLEENDEFDQDAVLFKLKTWNHVSLWKWDVDCDICAICRVVVTEPCLKVKDTLKSETNFCSARAAEKELQTAPWSGASAITATTTAVCRVGSPRRRAAHYASKTGSSSE